MDQARQLKVPLQGQRKMISLHKNDSQVGTELSFEFSEVIAEKEKAFRDDDRIIKNALMSGSFTASKLHFNCRFTRVPSCRNLH